MTEYTFLTHWEFAAPIDAVWKVIDDPVSWPSWWDAVRRVEKKQEGDDAGLGSVFHMMFKAPLGYSLGFEVKTVTRERPRLLEADSVGSLAGSGRWWLSETERGTSVHYLWQVRTTKTWMNLLAPVARPVFDWNHDRIMTRGGEGLAKQLGASMLLCENLNGARAASAWEARPGL